MPIKNDERESWMVEIAVFKSLATLGKEGRYISIEKGARAVKAPRIRKSRVSFFVFNEVNLD
jgi:hypothetical protein